MIYKCKSDRITTLCKTLSSLSVITRLTPAPYHGRTWLLHTGAPPNSSSSFSAMLHLSLSASVILDSIQCDQKANVLFFSDTGRISTATGNKSLGGIQVRGEVSELAISASSRDSVDVNACAHSSASGPMPKGRLVTGGKMGTEGRPSKRGEVGVKTEV